MSTNKDKGTGLPPLSRSQIARINAIITGRASARYPLTELKEANTKKKNKKARGGRAKTNKK